MKKLFFSLACILFKLLICAQSVKLLSPDGKLKLELSIRGEISYSIFDDNKPLFTDSRIDMSIENNGRLSENSHLKKTSIVNINATIISPVPEKRKTILDQCNELTVEFTNKFSLVFRLYNDGFAYRINTSFKDSIYVKNEIAEFNFSEICPVYFPEVQKRIDQDSFHTSFEEPYQLKPLDSITPSTLCFTPVLISTKTAPRIFITESDLEDYPGMFLRGTKGKALTGAFAPFPLEEKITAGEYPQSIVSKRASYIAHTHGNRSFPWRVIGIAREDKDLASTDIIYRLASPSRLKDVSWIKPGKATDEWIININLFDIPFKSGINTATYKYYIDFAKKFGFDRIMMDAGWSDYKDLFKINPNLNMEEIMSYAKDKGIGISLWTLAITLDRQLDSALNQFRKWGVNFIMTDFIDRDDQKTVNFYKRIAEHCAKNQIMIMYHGAFKPAGFGRTYPNAITRESVLGSEYNIWSDKASPSHDLLLPFIRMISGPMDYEPGILHNSTQKAFHPVWDDVMSQGTRTHQLAMFVVYDNPMQIFSGNPSQGLKEPAFMELLGNIPSTWDETVVLDGKVGEFIITARKKGNDWYIGAMTNWTSRELKINTAFLNDGKYQITKCEDGENADHYASDYHISSMEIQSGDPIIMKMAPGGGLIMKLHKK